MNELFFVLTLLAVLGCGLIAGVFFAFSTFVMKALARLGVADGIRAMQSINLVVVRSWFMAVFIGTAVICAPLLIYSLFRLDEPVGIFLLFASLLYLLGARGLDVGARVLLVEHRLPGHEPGAEHIDGSDRNREQEHGE